MKRLPRTEPAAADYLPPDPERELPHSNEAEEGVLGCCLQLPNLISERCKFVRPEVFYDGRRGIIWRAMREMTEKHRVIDSVTLNQWLRDRKELDQVGGTEYLATLPDKSPSPENLKYYLEIVLEKYALRQTIRVCRDTVGRVYDWDGGVEDLMLGVRADFEVLSSLKSGDQQPALKIWNVDELLKWEPPEQLRLIGDNEICMGYEGLTLIAGPGSSGKSLVIANLALAGAIGSGTWMGRPVHRQFKTLIIQAENGKVRMKEEMAAMKKAHPKVDLVGHVFISEPPEGGLPFHRPEFRAELRKQIGVIKPDLVALDPWSQIAIEDSAKDVVDALGQIRSCFPTGDDCPGLVIAAHTKKPRPEDVRRGRALTFSVSGSVALPNTARCVYMLLPWDEELEEERIYWACSKLNNGRMYPATVWHRRFGTFFDHDPDTDPRTWGEEKKQVEDARAIEENDLISAFGNEHVLRKSTIAKRIEEAIGVGYSTTMRAITPGKLGYLSGLVSITPEGWVKLRNGQAKGKNDLSVNHQQKDQNEKQ